MDRGRVRGFLDVRGREIVNGLGEPVLLNGWALGNWLHSEGYMWLCDAPRFDRPRRMEAVIESWWVSRPPTRSGAVIANVT